MRIVALLAAVAALSIACGGDSGDGTTANSDPTEAPRSTNPAPTAAATSRPASSQSGAQLDACALLTKAEVEAAVGASVLDPESEVEVPGKIVHCDFNSPRFPTLQVVRVTLFFGSDAEAKSFFDPPPDDMEIRNLGDDASWNQLLGTLTVLKGRYVVGVQATTAGGAVANDKRLTVAQALAPKAVAKAP